MMNPFCEIYRKNYTNEDYEVYAANRGMEALSLLSNVGFGVALSDILMPGVDGYQRIII